jgi:hypothetical protein
MNNTASKNVLAKILATENIMVRHDAKASTASFDLHKRVLTLPVWKNMTSSLMDMLIGHEVGHALYTPGMNPQQFIDFTKEIGKNMDLAKLVWNIVEDARIERMIKEEYPGLRRDFFHGYKEIYEMDMFEIEGKNINDLPFIDRMNLHFKIGPVLHDDVTFSTEEMVFVNRCQITRTHDEVKILSKDIYDFINQQDKEQNEQEKTVEKVTLSDDGDDSSFGDDKIDAPLFKSGGGDNTEESEEENGNTPPTDKMEEQKTNRTPIKNGDTMKNLEKNIQKRVDTQGSTTHICTLPDIDLERAIVDYKTFYKRVDAKSIDRACGSNYEYAGRVNEAMDRLTAKIKEDSMRSVNIMINQFNRKKAADESRKSRINKTGKLNMDKLHQYKISEDIFLSRTITKDGKNHGFVVFLDWSGSMSYTIHDVMVQLFQIATFCRKVKIPFEVYSFTNCFFDDKHIASFTPKDDDSINFDSFCMVNLLSSRMTNIEFDHAMKMMNWAGIRFNHAKAKKLGMVGLIPDAPEEFGMSSTPLNQAMVVALKIIPLFRKKYNLQIVNTVFMTDGDADSFYHRRGITQNEKYCMYDSETGLSYEYDGRGHTLTQALTKMIKDRTGCNMIHFHLETARKAENAGYRYFNGDETEDQKQKINKMYEDEGFFVATKKSNFDEVFVVKSTTEIEFGFNEDEFLESKKKSFTSLKSAFIKMNDRKITSRVMLNRFIDMISV